MAEENDAESGYKVAAKVDIQDLMAQDAEDESLRKYKEALLGDLSGNISPSDDPRRVVIEKMRVICENRPGGDIVYKLDSEADVLAMKSNPFTLKEACNYKIEVTFRVQHEIVSGLKYVNRVSRKGIKVLQEDEMLGSFGPQPKPHVVVFPRHGWEQAPSGMMARGSYTAKSTFVDDDKQKHLEYQYAFAIKKSW